MQEESQKTYAKVIRSGKLQKILAKDEIRIKRIKAEADYIEVKGKLMETINQNKIVTSIMKIEGIKEIVEE